jgi:hypothetical protein
MKKLSIVILVLLLVGLFSLFTPQEARSQMMFSFGLKSGYAFGIMDPAFGVPNIQSGGVMTYSKIGFSLFAESSVGVNLDLLIGDDYKTHFDFGTSLGLNFVFPINELGDGLMFTIQATGYYQIYLRATVDIMLSLYFRAGSEFNRYFYVGAGGCVIEISEYAPNWAKAYLEVGFGFVFY